MIEFFKDIIRYTYHYNQALLRHFIDNNNIPEKAIQLVNHTINAQEIWNARVGQQDCDTGVWEIRSLDELVLVDTKNYHDSLRLITNLDPEGVIKYYNSKGTMFENTIKDILFHMVNHSTYHRGQIASICKQYGIEPLVTDYIFYKRNAL